MAIEDSNMQLAVQQRMPSRLGSNAANSVSVALTALLADMFALYVKTKNFHWHVSEPHFR